MKLDFNHIIKYLRLFLWVSLLYACDGLKNTPLSEKEFSVTSCHIECSKSKDPKILHSHSFSNGDTAQFKLGGIISKKEAFNGNKSILLTKKEQFGLNVKLTDVKLNEYYKISVWRKDKKHLGALVAGSNNNMLLYSANKVASETREDGWEKLEIELEIPPYITELSIYCYIGKTDSAYFDQLEIKRIKHKIFKSYPEKTNISLYFSNKKMKRFEEFREEAFREGVHFNNGIWNKGVLSSEADILPVKTRFKGDWLDHLRGRKWSFRVKVRKGKTFNRLREFSLQNTASRHHLHEYLSHQLFLQEGLLTTRYDFYPVNINKESMGIYALEEHFTKQLVESSLRREGVILKFDENPMWRNIAIHKGLNAIKEWHNLPNYHTSRITAFGMSKILSDENLSRHFNVAHSLLHHFKYRTAPIEELFDIDKLAKFLALTELHQGAHGRIWHNLRFYYNPISCKLEFINYDNFTDYYQFKPFELLPLTFEGEQPLNIWHNLYPSIFQSELLCQKYYNYLEKYSNPQFTLDFYKKHQAKVKEFLPIIKDEHPYYHIDSTFLLDNAATIRSQLPELKNKIDSGFLKNLKIVDKEIELSQEYLHPLFPYFLNAYYSKSGDKAQLLIENYNNKKVNATRLLDAQKRPIYSINNVQLKAYTTGSYDSKLISLPYYKAAKYIEFEAPDSNRFYLTELSLWNKNTGLTPYQKLLRAETSNPNQIFSIQNDSLILTGKKVLKHKIVIPSGKTVIFEAGSQLDLIQEAALISYSAVQFKGTKKAPILIHSSDKTANGFAVMQANKKSKVEHTSFSNLNTFSYEGWNLSGAVNFYESEVEINHSTFEKNHCEDALNIIRTDFIVSNCTFLDIFADAFDSDFCTGKLINSTFDRVGNDAIDFSTSQIHIEDCSIKNISDKGVSGGEGSTLWVKNTSIENCNIGTASKDLSEVSLTNVTIKNSKYGLVLLQKKPEYGPALITAKQLTLSNCEEELLIEKGSRVDLEGKVIEGTHVNVAKLFY